MKNPRVIAAVAVVSLIVIVLGATYLNRPDTPAEPPDDVASPVETGEPPDTTDGGTDPAEQDTGEEPDEPGDEERAPPQESELDEHQIGGLVNELSQEDYSAAYDAAINIAAHLTAQQPGEDRTGRLGGLFTPDRAAGYIEGPAAGDVTTEPSTVNWVKPFEPSDPSTQVGLLVSVRYEALRPSAGGAAAFGFGDAEWRIVLVRDGQGGWVASDADLSTSTDMSAGGDG